MVLHSTPSINPFLLSENYEQTHSLTIVMKYNEAAMLSRPIRTIGGWRYSRLPLYLDMLGKKRTCLSARSSNHFPRVSFDKRGVIVAAKHPSHAGFLKKALMSMLCAGGSMV